MTRSILTIGEAGVDWVVRVPALPPRGCNAWAPAPERHGGGATANVAVGLARLGAPVSFCGKVGDDEPGRLVMADLKREGVDTSLVHIVPDALTQVVIAVVDADGERTFFTCSQGAAHTQLRAEEIDPDVIANAAWLHTSGTCLAEAPLRDAILRALRLAKDQGVTTSLDVNVRLGGGRIPEPFQAAVRKAILLADVVLGSAEEIVSLTSGTTARASAQVVAGRERMVVARLGAEGALAVFSPVVIFVPAFRTQVVDTLGAGDAFDAGFITARLMDLELVDALRWGNAVAALKIARPGARSLPSRPEVEELLNG